MDVMESGKPPLKDRGNMVTSVVSPKVTEGQSNSDGSNEEIAGKTSELHNGGTQLPSSTDNVVSSRPKKDTNDNAKKACVQGTEHTTSTGEKWKLQFDLSDSASTSDNDGSEVEATDKSGNRLKEATGSSTLKVDESEDSEAFKGFELESTSEICGILTRIIDSEGCRRSDLIEASTSQVEDDVWDSMRDNDDDDDDEIYYRRVISPVGDESGMETDENLDVMFSLKVISEPEVLLKEEPIEEDNCVNTEETSEKEVVESNTEETSEKEVVESNTEETSEKQVVGSNTEETSEKQVVESNTEETSEKEVAESELVRSDCIKPDSEDTTNSDLKKTNKKKVKEKDETIDDEPLFMKVDTVIDTPIEKSIANERISSDENISSDEKIIPDEKIKETDEPMDTSSFEMTTPVEAEVFSGLGEEISSEMTSSAASSPSVSSRGSLKVSASGGSSSGRYSCGDSPALSLSGSRGKKSSVDLSNPAFLKPIELGWKRELVYRNSSSCGTSNKMADIYYYTPAGKKVRSTLDGTDLTAENFTFFKGTLGVNDPTKEIIREAKKIVAKDPNSTPVKIPKPKLTTPKVSPTTDGLSPSSLTPGAKGPLLRRVVPPKTFPKIKVASLKLHKLTPTKTGSKQKRTDSRGGDDDDLQVAMLLQKSAKQGKPDSQDEGDMEMGMLPPMWSPSDSPFLKKNAGSSQSLTAASWPTKSGGAKKKTTPSEPCSIRCVGVVGLIPSLQCRLCLCLYHPECVGLGPITETIHSYVCKNCQHVKDGKPSLVVPASKLFGLTNSSKMVSSVTPPPLTPISTLGAGNKASVTDGTVGQSASKPPSPPKLQRLPCMGETGKLLTVPRFVKVPRGRESVLAPQQGVKAATNKGTIVGAVTTWLPPSSTIQLSPTGGSKTSSAVTTYSNSVCSTSTIVDSSTNSPSTTGVQAIAQMGNKKYIVVPKHNVLSVSPAMAATATTPTSKSSVQVGDSSPLGDKAPPALATNLVLSNTTGKSSTVLSNSQALIGQPQVLMTSSTSNIGEQPLSLVQNPASLATFVSSTPSTLLVSSGNQNPPGILLVPFMGTGSTLIPQDSQANKGPTPQYVIVNGPSSNFIMGNIGQPKPADAAGRTGDTGDGSLDKMARDSEDADNKGKRKMPTQEFEGPASKRSKTSSLVEEPQRQFMQFFMMNVCTGYSSLLHVFQYLKVQELLRAARVCRMWRDVASHRSLWQTVRMKNSQVVDWDGLVQSLRRHETEHLDLRKMLLPSEDTNAMWDDFCQGIGRATSLKRLDLCKCPARSLTTFKDLGKMGTDVIGSLENLETLELGECCELPEEFGPETLTRLKKLERLRLEKVQGKDCPTLSILSGIAALSNLTHLELVNFDVKPGFDKELARCTNIRRLLMIPTYVTQSATTNHMLLNGVNQLNGSLTHFVWGVTHELLRVTELFVDQCEGQKDSKAPSKAGKKSWGSDSIPVLKPIQIQQQPLSQLTDGCEAAITWDDENSPIDASRNDKPIDNFEGREMDKDESDDAKASAAAPQVEILPLPKLQKLLQSSLPKTKVKILKIPFHATWRQSITDLTP
ncbi:hypothetical protein C0J52_02318 [Blattella germanica]|nr:hypothetical protein C0J52_02318 [Blattella germanica]